MQIPPKKTGTTPWKRFQKMYQAGIFFQWWKSNWAPVCNAANRGEIGRWRDDFCWPNDETHLLLDTSSLFYPTDGKNPAPPWIIETLNHGIRHLSTVARFLPSTVCLVFFFTPLRLCGCGSMVGVQNFEPCRGTWVWGPRSFSFLVGNPMVWRVQFVWIYTLANKFILKI